MKETYWSCVGYKCFASIERALGSTRETPATRTGYLVVKNPSGEELVFKAVTTTAPAEKQIAKVLSNDNEKVHLFVEKKVWNKPRLW